MDSRSLKASSNPNALEMLGDTMLLSEGFYAGSAAGHSSGTLHGHSYEGRMHHYFKSKHGVNGHMDV